MSALAIAPEPGDSAIAIACLTAYFAELAARFDGGFDPGQPGYANPKDSGEFFVARRDDHVMGCGALKSHAPGIAEIKRMWVAPSARGQGVATTLLAALENEARRQGYIQIVLDTNKALTEAHALYRKAGYRETARFNDNPYAHLWFVKDLT
jgi:ribosomal protein S18 acetylase RimI-like enzyme